MANVAPEFDIDPPAEGPALIVDLDGFEGPLDLLLDLARRQKIDLRAISMAALAAQYIRYIDAARAQHLELAADYLVMAAWLTMLKSRLLLPEPPAPDEPSAEQLASELAERLRRLEAMRRAARWLDSADEAARDRLTRGAPEALIVERGKAFDAGLFDLLSAYARQRQVAAHARVTVSPREVWSLQTARECLLRGMAEHQDWCPLSACLAGTSLSGGLRRSAHASTFAASLELVREGEIEVRQAAAFAPLLLRRRDRHEAIDGARAEE